VNNKNKKYCSKCQFILFWIINFAT